MNAIPATFDLTPLVGGQLQHVCIDQYQVQLHFEKGGLSCHIQGGGKLVLEIGGQALELFHGTWRNSHGLERLVGESVTAWCTRSQLTFSVSFASGAVLVFACHEGPHEDFTVHIGDDFWVL